MDTKNDILILHSNNEAYQKWTTNLAYFLNIILERFLSRKPIIITHDNLTDAENTQQLINSSQIIMVVLSADIVPAIEANSALNKNLIQEKRIFKILKTEIPYSQHPANIKALLSYEFFERDKEEDFDISNESLIYEIERHYWMTITDLSLDVYNVIKEKTTSHNEIFSGNIFLADTTPDQFKNRENLKRELKRMGYYIFPDLMLPENPLEKKEVILNYLKKSCVSIHIIGASYGENLSDLTISDIEFQNKIAAEYCSQPGLNEGNILNRFIWLTPNVTVYDDKQNTFLEQLKRDTEILAGASLIRTPLEYFKTLVKSQLYDIKNPNFNNTANDSATKTSVFLIHETIDRENIEIIKAFLSQHNFTIIEPVFLNEKKNMLKANRQHLIQTDTVLIYFDSGDTFWLQSKIHDLVKSPGYGRKRPFQSKIIFVSCDCEISKQVVSDTEIKIVRNFDEIVPALLNHPLSVENKR